MPYYPPQIPGPAGPAGPAGSSAVLQFSTTSLGAPADTRFLDPWSAGGLGAVPAPTTEVMCFVAPRPGTLRNFFVRHPTALGNGNAVTYRVRVNGANTAITKTLVTGAIGQTSDLINIAVVAAGDRVTVSATKAVAIGNGAIQPIVTMEFV